MNESEAARVVEEACEHLGGKRVIVGSPRHPFAMNPTEDVVIDGQTVTIHFSEISSPAIALFDGWIFEIREDELVLLSRPRQKRAE